MSLAEASYRLVANKLEELTHVVSLLSYGCGLKLPGMLYRAWPRVVPLNRQVKQKSRSAGQFIVCSFIIVQKILNIALKVNSIGFFIMVLVLSTIHMNTKKKVIYSVVTIIVLTFSIFYTLKKVPVFADTINDQIVSKEEFNLQIAGENTQTKFSIIGYKNSEFQNRYYLKIYMNWFKSEEIELEGFEKSATFIKQSQKDGIAYLLITGDVGAHSQNLNVVEIENGNLSLAEFEKDGKKDKIIYSDWPKFELINENSDQLSINIYFRDYNKDPLTDFLILQYQLESKTFKYHQLN